MTEAPVAQLDRAVDFESEKDKKRKRKR